MQDPEKKVFIKFLPDSFVWEIWILVSTFLVFAFFFAVSSVSAEQQLTRLRQGRVHIQTDGVADNLTIHYSPIYGWNEPLMLLGPDGRLLRKEFLGHEDSGKLTIKLDQGPGNYELILKPSYMWRLSLSGGKMVYEPPKETTGLRMIFKGGALYFLVPDNTVSFKLFWTNRRGYKGPDARIQVFNPNNELISDDEMSKIDPQIACRMLGLERSECSGGAFSPRFDPAPPHEISIHDPLSGIWKIYIGPINAPFPREVGVWLSGIPSLFAQNPESLYVPQDETLPVSSNITVLDDKLSKPLLGVVGPFGPAGGAREKMMTDYGVQAEKVFLNHDNQEPENDNIDPYDADIRAFNFSRHKNRLWPRPGRFSTVVFNHWAGWMKSMTFSDRVPEWSEWAHVAAVYAMQERQMKSDAMTVQFFNEPNFVMKMDQYIALLKAAGSRIKNDPQSTGCPIAAPAISTALSKYNPDTRNFLNKNWIQQTLKEADEFVDIVMFNVYGARDLEDTFLYTTIVDQVDQIIRETNPDGIIEPIIIGATNREGGLAPTHLFNDWEGGLWWASVLSQVMNTGRVKVINYFSIIDAGIRQKGLFTENRKPKYQALIQQLFANAMLTGDLYQTLSDHQGLEAVTLKNESTLTMILINKSRFALSSTIHCPFGDIDNVEKINIYQGFKSIPHRLSANQATIEVPAQSVTWLELNLKEE